jgi:hypothetical protein
MPAPASTALSGLMDQIESELNADVDRPCCVHRLYESLARSTRAGEDPDQLLSTVQDAADELTRQGRARKEAISAVAIGVHCQDTVYWSVRSPNRALQDFGPEYESPTILRRLASHIQCHGL